MREMNEQIKKILGEKVKIIIYLFILYIDADLEALVGKMRVNLALKNTSTHIAWNSKYFRD